MKLRQWLATAVLIMPTALCAGDFSNPTPYGTSGGQGSNSGSGTFSMVTVGTAEALRIAHMNIGLPTTVYNQYAQTTLVQVGTVTIGNDNSGDISINQTSNDLCVISSSNILNMPAESTDQHCVEPEVVN